MSETLKGKGIVAEDLRQEIIRIGVEPVFALDLDDSGSHDPTIRVLREIYRWASKNAFDFDEIEDKLSPDPRCPYCKKRHRRATQDCNWLMGRRGWRQLGDSDT